MGVPLSQLGSLRALELSQTDLEENDYDAYLGFRKKLLHSSLAQLDLPPSKFSSWIQPRFSRDMIHSGTALPNHPQKTLNRKSGICKCVG